MAYWDKLSQTEAYRQGKAAPRSNAYAAQYPTYEQTTPQYPSPSPSFLAQQGFASNTIVYSCIDKRMRAISAAPLVLYNTAHALPTAVNRNRIMDILHAPNERMSEKLFWQATSIYCDIAGFSAWEIERNRLHEPINLWPMRPDFCSFLRGDGRPLRAIRYQPYSLPPQDIDIDNILLFQNFDPRNPMLKGYSPTMSALKDIGVDNGMSNFLYSFIYQGARFSGLLTTDQDLDDIEAERIKQRWKEQHGGVENWNDIAVLGNGATYQNISMNFRDMAFPDLDGRIEARLCMAFQMPPVLLGAKIGLMSSTFTNYSEARKAWYEEWVTPQWESFAEQFCIQMLREPGPNGYKINPHYKCMFMTKNISALQENRDLAFRRAVSAARANVLTRDEARAEIGIDPIDNAPTFVGPVTDLTNNAPTGANDDEIANQNLTPTEFSEAEDQPLGSDTPAQQLERKQFKSFATKRIKEGKPEAIYEFKWLHTPALNREILVQEVLND